MSESSSPVSRWLTTAPLKRGILRRCRVEALTWNLYHGRDAPPDPALFTIRSRLLRISERNATHLQVNSDLRAAFATVLAAGTVGRRAAPGMPAAVGRVASERL